jgi:ABC-2 type transport system permease protein
VDTGIREHQPMTPIIETMRSLLIDGRTGCDLSAAFARAAGILIVSYSLALAIYRRTTPVPATSSRDGIRGC